MLHSLQLVIGTVLLLCVESTNDSQVARALATVQHATSRMSSRLAPMGMLEAEEQERQHDLAFLKQSKLAKMRLGRKVAPVPKSMLESEEKERKHDLSFLKRTHTCVRARARAYECTFTCDCACACA